MNPIISGIQRFFGGPQVITPVPQSNFLNTPDKMSLYNTTQNQIQTAQKQNPHASYDWDGLSNYAMKYGGLDKSILTSMKNPGYQVPQLKQNSASFSIPQILGTATNDVKGFFHKAAPQAQATFNPDDVPDTPLPTGIDRALQYVSQYVPGGQDPKTYYPALSDPQFMAGIEAADKAKPGLGNVLLMQAFHESTLGRAANNNNLFGALPGGEGSGNNAGFQNYADSLNYQLGPSMLGGGGNPNMNIMNEQGALTARRLAKLYQSYNPEGAYIKPMLDALK